VLASSQTGSWLFLLPKVRSGPHQEVQRHGVEQAAGQRAFDSWHGDAAVVAAVEAVVAVVVGQWL
jgi:hypothetical protein